MTHGSCGNVQCDQQLHLSSCAYVGGGAQWLKSDEPIIKIVAKMLEVIVTKLPVTTDKTMLLQRLHQVRLIDMLLLLYLFLL